MARRHDDDSYAKLRDRVLEVAETAEADQLIGALLALHTPLGDDIIHTITTAHPEARGSVDRWLTSSGIE